MRGYSAIALVEPKTPANVGGAMRAAGCYGASLVVLGGKRPERLAKLPADMMRTWKHVPHLIVGDVFDALPLGCVPIAVDLLDGAQSLVDFKHPERALYIFGPEDGTLRPDVVSRCVYKVFVPTVHCMNLAATVNVVLYDRLAKGGN